MKVLSLRPDNWIFVFGSNEAGRHGKGAALMAKELYGAQGGVGEGFAGRSYALPTKDQNLRTREIEEVRGSVATFLEIAEQRPHLKFQVTRLGCGLAGFTDEQIAPMFEDAPRNVLLPRRWLKVLGKGPDEFRVVVSGSVELSDFDLVAERLDLLLGQVSDPVTIVTGTQPGVEQLAETYAGKRHLGLVRFIEVDQAFKDRSYQVANETMAWFSDAVALFWDGQEFKYQHLLDVAKREELPVRETQFELS